MSKMQNLEFDTLPWHGEGEPYAEAWIKIMDGNVMIDMVPVAISEDGQCTIQDGPYGLSDICFDLFGYDEEKDEAREDIQPTIDALCYNATKGKMEGVFTIWGQTFTYTFVHADNCGIEY